MGGCLSRKREEARTTTSREGPKTGAKSEGIWISHSSSSTAASNRSKGTSCFFRKRGLPHRGRQRSGAMRSNQLGQRPNQVEVLKKCNGRGLYRSRRILVPGLQESRDNSQQYAAANSRVLFSSESDPPGRRHLLCGRLFDTLSQLCKESLPVGFRQLGKDLIASSRVSGGHF